MLPNEDNKMYYPQKIKGNKPSIKAKYHVVELTT
jgi:hypothetical protein